MESHTVDEVRQTLEACACPRAKGKKLTAPRCAPDFYSHGGSLFVKFPADLDCQCAWNIGHGIFCTCPQRIQAYLKHKI